MADLERIRGELKARRLTIAADSIAGAVDPPDFSQEVALPWEQGYRAARRARRAWNIPEGPVRNHTLSTLLDVTPEAISMTEQPDTPLGAGWRDREGDRVPIVLRSRHRQGRRFEIMRLVADYSVATVTGDHLLPMTSTGTFRQKYQRAFAAEFLCPYEELNELLPRGDLDEVDIEIAAHRYDVSPLLIRTTLVNAGRLPREILVP